MKKILIVEDELPIAELEKDYLELSDFEVTIETDGIEGEDMDWITSISLDWILPLMIRTKSHFLP